jgi:magnesium transporter
LSSVDFQPRDLRKLDSLHPNLVPTILSRRTAILINCLHIRALIKADRVILFDSAGTKESEIQGRFRWHLEGNVVRGLSPNSDGGEDQPGGGLVYEHR